MGEKSSKKKTTVHMDVALWKRLRYACTERMVDQQVAISDGISMWVGAVEAGKTPSTPVKLPASEGEGTVYYLLVRSIQELRAEILSLRTQIMEPSNEQNSTTPAASAPIIGGGKEPTGDFVRRAQQRITEADELTRRMQTHLKEPSSSVSRTEDKGKGSKARSA